MTRELEPQPGAYATVQAPPVDVPGVDQVGDAAAANGQLIAVLIVIVVVGSFIGYLWKQAVVRMLLVGLVVGYVVYIVTKGQ